MLMGGDAVPAALTVQDRWGGWVMRRLDDGWCAALDRRTLRCTIYAQRPYVCREFELGGHDCLEERRALAPAEARVGAPQPNNPLHGITLEKLLNELLARYGWAHLGRQLPVRCFLHEPSLASSLKFLRRTPWARERVEALYLRMRAGSAGAAGQDARTTRTRA